MNNLSSIEIKHETMSRQLANELRKQIMEGDFAADRQFPSHRKIAEEVGVSASTANEALRILEREGCLERRHGSGTFVCGRAAEIKTIGIYHLARLMTLSEGRFARTLYRCLIEQTEHSGRVVSPWPDVRPQLAREQGMPWTELEEAAQTRKFEALIGLNVGRYTNASWLSRLPVPVAVFGSALRASVEFDMGGFAEDAVQALARAGCRSVALVAPLYCATDVQPGSNYSSIFARFQAAADTAGLCVREEWVLSRERWDASRYASQRRCGYEAFLRLWESPERPEGVIVADDVHAEGVVTAALEWRLRVPQELRFVFFKLAETDLVCPFSATLAEFSVTDAARALIELVERQFAGQPVESVQLACRMITAEAAGAVAHSMSRRTVVEAPAS